VFCRLFIFFFQAEDGIRDVAVTGVQTCALPIFDALGGACLCTTDRCARFCGAATFRCGDTAGDFLTVRCGALRTAGARLGALLTVCFGREGALLTARCGACFGALARALAVAPSRFSPSFFLGAASACNGKKPINAAMITLR